MCFSVAPGMPDQRNSLGEKHISIRNLSMYQLARSQKYSNPILHNLESVTRNSRSIWMQGS